jgi:hypothetical protein
VVSCNCFNLSLDEFLAFEECIFNFMNIYVFFSAVSGIRRYLNSLLCLSHFSFILVKKYFLKYGMEREILVVSYVGKYKNLAVVAKPLSLENCARAKNQCWETVAKAESEITVFESPSCQVQVAYVCNPSCNPQTLEGSWFEASPTDSSRDPNLKISNTKKGWWRGSSDKASI